MAKQTHGTYSSYKHHGCRCEECGAAAYRYRKARRLGLTTGRLVDATGTVRRLHALAAIGWPYGALAPMLGKGTAQGVYQMTTRREVSEDNAAAVRAVYDQLSMTPGPSDVTRRVARKAGWAPPLAWDDDTIDDPAAGPVGVGGIGVRAGVWRTEDIVEVIETGGHVTWAWLEYRTGLRASTIRRNLAHDRANRPDLIARVNEFSGVDPEPIQPEYIRRRDRLSRQAREARYREAS